MASAHNDVELVRLLINRGARLNATDNQGHSPLKWARETGSTRCILLILKVKVEKNLIPHLQQQQPQLAAAAAAVAPKSFE